MAICCPHCGSPVMIRGSRWECGWCGDFGALSSLHPSERAKLDDTIRMTVTVTVTEPEEGSPKKFTPEELETTIRAIVTFRATAAVCYESGSARKLLYAAWRHGIRIPEQCSIAAFNDEEMLDYTIPPLARIRIPAAEMGTETVRQLMNRISEKVEPKGSSLRYCGTLVEGGSIAPPPRE